MTMTSPPSAGFLSPRLMHTPTARPAGSLRRSPCSSRATARNRSPLCRTGGGTLGPAAVHDLRPHTTALWHAWFAARWRLTSYLAEPPGQALARPLTGAHHLLTARLVRRAVAAHCLRALHTLGMCYGSRRTRSPCFDAVPPLFVLNEKQGQEPLAKAEPCRRVPIVGVARRSPGARQRAQGLVQFDP